MLLLVGLVPSLVVGVALFRAYREVDDAFLDEWSRAHALRLDATNRPMVRWYLRNARVLRTWGALAGLFLPGLVVAAFGLEARAPQSWVWIFVGYLVGALYAELSLVRPVAVGRRVASLVPRDLTAYLPRRLVVAQRCLGVIAIAAAVAVMVVPFGDRSDAIDPDRRSFAVAALVAAAFAVVLERTQRWLVHRAQPFTDPSLVAADDAIRAQSVHSLAGAGLAVLLLVDGGICFVLSRSDVQVLRWALWLPAGLSWLAALWACLYWGHRAWRVPRPAPPTLTSPA